MTTNRASGFCSMAVFVDGMYTTIRNVDELSLDDVEALEVYRGASEIPIEYHAPTYARTCGALFVQSRIALND